jgi:hypothetical protein
MDDQAKCRQIESSTEEIYLRLRAYIGYLTSTRGLPAGYSDFDEIIHEAVGKLLDGARNWDPKTQPLIRHLRGIVKSMLSKKGLYDREGRRPLGNIAAGVEPVPADKEESLLTVEEAEERWKVVKDVLGDDKEALEYIEAIRLGIETPAEIAEMTGIPIKRIYEIPRKLRKLSPAIINKMKEDKR